MTEPTHAIAAALHEQHVAEFDWMKGDRWSDPVGASECGNCQRWARYALAARVMPTVPHPTPDDFQEQP